jgi:hypothetical protein
MKNRRYVLFSFGIAFFLAALLYHQKNDLNAAVPSAKTVRLSSTAKVSSTLPAIDHQKKDNIYSTSLKEKTPTDCQLDIYYGFEKHCNLNCKIERLSQKSDAFPHFARAGWAGDGPLAANQSTETEKYYYAVLSAGELFGSIKGEPNSQKS